MKNLLLLLLIMPCSIITYSQEHRSYNSSTYSIGFETSVPMGIFHDIGYNIGIGGSAQGEYLLDQSIGLTVNAGILSYSISNDLGKGAYSVMPIMAGGKYYFTKGLYGHVQFGAGIAISRDASTSFAFSPSFGYILIKHIDLEAKFMGYSNSGGSLKSFGVRLAYIF